MNVQIHFNVVALVDTSGNVVERFAYDAFGGFSVLTLAWGARGSSSYGWNYLHQGGRWDADGGLYSFRHREYSPTLGRWLQIDPIGFISHDLNHYLFVRNSPLNLLDSDGLQPTKEKEVPPKPAPPELAPFDKAPSNCAGLAFRLEKGLSMEQVKKILKKEDKLNNPAMACPKGSIKIWYWEYFYDLEVRISENPDTWDNAGSGISLEIGNPKVRYPRKDFHMVGCESDCEKVPSKNGTDKLDRDKDTGEVILKPGGGWSLHPTGRSILYPPFAGQDGKTYRVVAYNLKATQGVYCIKKEDIPKK